MKDTALILKDFFENILSLSGVVTGVEVTVPPALPDEPGQTQVSVDGCNSGLFHLREQMLVYLDGNPYRVLSRDHEANTFTVEGEILSAETYRVPNPKYHHGTPVQVNKELTLEVGTQVSGELVDSMPLVWLFETFRERVNPPGSGIPKVAEGLRLHFLDYAKDESDWLVEDCYQERVVGLSQLADAVIRQLRANRKLFYLENESIDKYPYARWGKFPKGVGGRSSQFNETLSGVEVHLSLPLRFCSNC